MPPSLRQNITNIIIRHRNRVRPFYMYMYMHMYTTLIDRCQGLFQDFVPEEANSKCTYWSQAKINPDCVHALH